MWERGRGGGAGCFIVKKLNILGGGGDAGSGGMGGRGACFIVEKNEHFSRGGRGCGRGGVVSSLKN